MAKGNFWRLGEGHGPFAPPPNPPMQSMLRRHVTTWPGLENFRRFTVQVN